MQTDKVKIKKNLNKTGLTLIELILVVVLIGIIVPPLLFLFGETAERSTRSESINQGIFYAQEIMEEIKSKRYDENTEPDWSSLRGMDAGETGRSDFDDVDDFNGYSDTPPGGYTRSVQIVYLDENIVDGGSWQVLDPQPAADADTTDYKKIIVTVGRSDTTLLDNLQIVSIVSGGY